MIHVHQAQVVLYPLAHFLAALAPTEDLLHRQLDVLVAGQPGQQGVILKDHRTVGPGLIDLPALQYGAALGCLAEAGHDIEDRGLAAARVTDNGYELALGYLQVDVIQGAKDATTGREVDGYSAQLEKTRLAALGRRGYRLDSLAGTKISNHLND